MHFVFVWQGKKNSPLLTRVLDYKFGVEKPTNFCLKYKDHALGIIQMSATAIEAPLLYANWFCPSYYTIGHDLMYKEWHINLA